MAANDELMTDTPEFEVSDESGAGVSDQALEGGREPVDERSVEEEQGFNETQPLEDVRSIADTQPLEDIHLLAEVQPSEDAPELANSQSLATTSSDQSAIIDSDAEALKALKKLEEQRKQDRRKRTIVIIVACVIVLALIGAFAASQMVAQSSQGESGPSTATARRTNLTSSVQTTGIVLPGSQVNVTAGASGVIKDVLVSDGQNVEAGTPLFTLSNPDIDKEISEAQITMSRANRDLAEARAGVSEAQAELKKAKKEYDESVAEDKAAERKAVAHAKKVYQETYDEEIAAIPEDATKKERKELKAEAKKAAQDAYDLTYALESPGEISEFDPSMYNASIDSANSSVVGAEEYVSDLQRSYNSILEEADKLTVRAPASGTVLDLLAVPGATVGFASGGTSTAKSDVLAKIADLSRASVDVEVSEVDISTVAVGQRAVLAFAGVPGLELEGRVESIATVSSNISDGSMTLAPSDAVTYKVNVSADVSDERLKPGMSTSVKIMTKDVPNMLVVPASAVEEENGTAYVTVAKDDKATETERRAVVIADRTSREVAIASGLEEGETVIDRSGSASASSEGTSSSSAR